MRIFYFPALLTCPRTATPRPALSVSPRSSVWWTCWTDRPGGWTGPGWGRRSGWGGWTGPGWGLKIGWEGWTGLGWRGLFVWRHRERSLPDWSCNCNSGLSFCNLIFVSFMTSLSVLSVIWCPPVWVWLRSVILAWLWPVAHQPPAIPTIARREHHELTDWGVSPAQPLVSFLGQTDYWPSLESVSQSVLQQ